MLFGNEEAVLSDKFLQSICKEFNETNLHTVRLPLNSCPRGVVCVPGRVPGKENQYIEPRTKHIFEINHVSQACLGFPVAAESNLFPAQREPLRKALEDQIALYVRSFFPPDSLENAPNPLANAQGNAEKDEKKEELTKEEKDKKELSQSASERYAAAQKPQLTKSVFPLLPSAPNRNRNLAWGVFSPEETAEEKSRGTYPLAIVIASRNLNLKNFWGCSWSSEWRVMVKFENAAGTSLAAAGCAGTVESCAHHFEEGNVQLRSHKDVRFEVESKEALKSVDKLAVEIVQRIKTIESALHDRTVAATTPSTSATSTASAHAPMTTVDGLPLNEGALKECRRVFPISRETFDWNPLRHVLAREILASATPSLPPASSQGGGGS